MKGKGREEREGGKRGGRQMEGGRKRSRRKINLLRRKLFELVWYNNITQGECELWMA